MNCKSAGYFVNFRVSTIEKVNPFKLKSKRNRLINFEDPNPTSPTHKKKQEITHHTCANRARFR